MIVAVIPRNKVRDIIFNWDGIEYNCPSLKYNFSSINCGKCIFDGPTQVNCSSFTTSTAGITCQFSVRTKICGNIFGEFRTTTINLKGMIILLFYTQKSLKLNVKLLQ